jgi:hypothetical protein
VLLRSMRWLASMASQSEPVPSPSSLTVAVLAYRSGAPLGRVPAGWMWISSVASYSVATDAIGGGPLVMTRRALDNSAARRSTVIIGISRVPHPSRWMHGSRVTVVAAHAVANVARVAGGRLVAARAGRRVGSRFDGMARENVASVLKGSFRVIQSLQLGPKPRGGVVAIGAVVLRVTGHTEPLGAHCVRVMARNVVDPVRDVGDGAQQA